MKKNTHPQYYKDATVTCACGNKFTTGSTKQSIQVELCAKCHPFYTGKQRLVDTENLVKKFETKKKKAEAHKAKLEKKKEKQAKRKTKVEALKGSKKVTLKDMLKQIKDGK